MGIYHQLHVINRENQKEDVGGYSKGGSQTHWLLAFSPEEYENNLETILQTKDFSNIKVGYTSTVEKAIEHLRIYRKRLYMLRDKLFSLPMKKKYKALDDSIYRLIFKLEQYPRSYTLQLDESDGSSYCFKREKDAIVGLEDFWYQNEALKNESIISEFEQFEISIQDAVHSYAEALPNVPLQRFYDEFWAILGENERGWGPNGVTEFFDEEYEKNSTRFHIDNPRSFFQTVMHEFISTFKNKEDLEACFDILYMNIEETLQYVKS